MHSQYLYGARICNMDSYGRKIITVTGTGTFLSVVNTSSLIIAIPTILLDLKISFFLAIWIIVAYSLALTVLTPILGKYSDIVGRKRLYSYGYLVFFAGSVVSTIATRGDILLTGRIIQGIGGAFLFSNSLAIITDTFRAVELREAMGINAAILAFGTSIGPLVGGLLTDLTWRAIFIFNIPISLAGFFLSTRYVRDIAAAKKGHIDLMGAVLLSGTIILGIIFLTVLPGVHNVTPSILILAISTLVFFLLFWKQEHSSPRPIINPEIMRNHTMSISALALVFGSLSRFSVLLLLTLFFQGPLKFSPLLAGILLIPLAGSMGVFSFLSGFIKQRISDTALEVTGLVFTGIGAILLAFLLVIRGSFMSMAIAMIIVGAGSGVFYTPNSTIIMLSVPATMRGETAGIRTLMVNLGSVMGLTLVFMLISSYVPSEIVNSIFLGLTQVGMAQYITLFYTASEIVLLLSGVLSLIPVPLIFAQEKRNKSGLSDTNGHS